MEIVRLVPHDAVAYRALMLDSYARDPEAFTSTFAERVDVPLTFWEERLAGDATGDQLVLGAWVDGQLAGVVGLLRQTRSRRRHKALLYGMSVAPVFRRRGLGAALVLRLLDEARTWPDLAHVQLTVSASNEAARRLYARCGFRAWGTEPDANRVDGRSVALVHMWCPLTPDTPADR